MCKISIVIPIYNAEKYIENCMNSILQQSFKEFEIILIDDGSTDNSRKIVRKYQEKYNFIRVYSKENGGVSSARNLGIQMAEGKYITFIDADDEVKEKYLEILYNNSQEYDYIVSGIINCYMKNNGTENYYVESVLEESCGSSLKELSRDFFVRGFIHSSCGKLYRSEILKEYNICFPNIRLSEDSIFNILYLKHVEKWKILKEAQYIYMHRVNGQNATSIFRENDVDIYVELHNQMRKLPIKKSYVDATLYAQYLAICLKILKQNISNEEKIILLKNIMKKEHIRKTLIFSASNAGEWILGLLICFEKIRLIEWWRKR